MIRLALPAAGVALLLAAACNGDDGPAATPTAVDTPAPAATPEVTPAGSPTLTPAPETTGAEIELDEWAIRPGRTRARPGTVIFKVSNVGELAHQFLVVRTDLGTAELPRSDAGGADEPELDIVGRIDSIPPGTAAELETQVEPGSYVLICNIVDGGVSHYLRGMYNGFTVAFDAPPANLSPTPTATPLPDFPLPPGLPGAPIPAVTPGQ
jgi:uncharacterized cupredoxin-like copper-binding protein